MPLSWLKTPPIFKPISMRFLRNAAAATIAHFHPRSSPHRPLVPHRLLHDGRSLYVLFHARDRYVRCTHTEYQDMVCKDSCVGFAQPKADRGYFNFEVNCGGTMLIWYIEDPTRVEGAMRKFTKVSPEHARHDSDRHDPAQTRWPGDCRAGGMAAGDRQLRLP